MRQHIRLPFFFALVFELGQVGCGAEAPATFRDYALRSAQATCQRAFRCCGTSCPTTVDATFNRTIENTQYAVDTGLLIFDSAKAQACLEANASVYTECTQYLGLVDTSHVSEACEGILTGTLPLGAACSMTTDYCRPDGYCDLDTTTNPTMPQLRCRRYLTVGEACDGSVECAPKSRCDEGVSNTCIPIPPRAKAGEPCGGMITCASSLFCLADGTCGLQQESGMSCNANNQCLSNRCAINTCTVAMTKPPTVSDMICAP
jgi:hypothetical protein